MQKAVFPSFLSSKAKIYLNFTRVDFLILGVGYLILSKLSSNTLVSFGINAIILILFKFFTSKMPRGFLRFLRESKNIEWAYQMEERNE
jgi:hypothetical protein